MNGNVEAMARTVEKDFVGGSSKYMNSRHRVHSRAGIGFLGLLLTAYFPAHAAPPFRTDDPEAVEHKHAEFYVFSQQTLTGDGRTGVLPALEFNYGVYENVQFHLVTPWAFSKSSGEGTTHGYGDTELCVKWQLNEESETMPIIGVFPLVEIPTGNSHKGLGNGKQPGIRASLAAEEVGQVPDVRRRRLLDQQWP